MSEQAQYYMVFGSTKRPLIGGGKYLDWSQPPIGVYPANSPEDACKTAAQDSEAMGTFVALPCVPWGLELMDTGPAALGRSGSPNDKIAAYMDRMEQREKQILQLAQKVHDGE